MAEFSLNLNPLPTPKVDNSNFSSGGIIKYDKLKNTTAGDVPEIDYSQGSAVNDENINKTLTALSCAIIGERFDTDSDAFQEFIPKAEKALATTGATIAVAGISLVEGLGEFGEAVVDFANMLGTATITPGLALVDAGQAIYGTATGQKWTSVTEDAWKGTMSTVSKKYVKSFFDSQYDNNNVMKTLKENSAAFDQVRAVFSGIGYYAGVTALTVATAGTAGIATASSAAIVSGATGISQGSEEAWSNGASLTGGLVAGVENGAWEGAKGYLGGTVLQNGFLNVTAGSSTGIKVANEALKVGANAVVNSADPVVSAAVKSNYTGDFNSNFQEAGGLDSVKTSALTGAIFTAAVDSIGQVKKIPKKNMTKEKLETNIAEKASSVHEFNKKQFVGSSEMDKNFFKKTEYAPIVSQFRSEQLDAIKKIELIDGSNGQMINMYMDNQKEGAILKFFLAFDNHGIVHVVRVSEKAKEIAKVMKQVIESSPELLKKYGTITDDEIEEMASFAIGHDLGMGVQFSKTLNEEGISEDVIRNTINTTLSDFKLINNTIKTNSLLSSKYGSMTQAELLDMIKKYSTTNGQSNVAGYDLIYELVGDIKTPEEMLKYSKKILKHHDLFINYNQQDDEEIMQMIQHTLNDTYASKPYDIKEGGDLLEAIGVPIRVNHPLGSTNKMLSDPSIYGEQTSMGALIDFLHSKSSSGIKDLENRTDIELALQKVKSINSNFDYSKWCQRDANGNILTEIIESNGKQLEVPLITEDSAKKIGLQAQILRFGDSYANKTGFNQGGGIIDIQQKADSHYSLEMKRQSHGQSDINLDEMSELEAKNSKVSIVYDDKIISLDDNTNEDFIKSKIVNLGEKNMGTITESAQLGKMVITMPILSNDCPACTMTEGIFSKFKEQKSYENFPIKYIIKLPEDAPIELKELYIKSIKAEIKKTKKYPINLDFEVYRLGEEK